MQTGHSILQNKTVRSHPMIVVGVIVIIIALVSFCIDGNFREWHTPAESWISIISWFRIHLGHLVDSEAWRNRKELIEQMPYYGGVIERIRLSAMTFGCGMLMALSGSIFQTVFRNPMAAPTMLGVSTGVNVGVLILVLQYGLYAESHLSEKYLYCYIGAGVMLTLVLVLGKISSGKKRMSVFDLLIIGVILSSIIGAIMSFFTMGMENDIALVYREIMMMIRMDTSKQAFSILGFAMLISLVPMFMLRFSFNAVSFESDDTRSLGINAYLMKIVTLVLGTIMITAAMIHCGSAGMISLVAPFIARGLFGAEFRRQFWGTLLIGGGILLICKDIIGLIPFGTDGIPLGTIVDFVALPVFVLIVVKQKRVWE